jgi:hypothetical protein
MSSGWRGVIGALVGLGVIAMAMPVRADDGAMAAVGGSVHLMKEHPQIEMVRESVDAHVAGDSARVTCVFTLKNHGRATDVVVGFPNTGGGDGVGVTRFRSFSSTVDGHPLRTTFVVENEDRDSGDDYRAWYVRRVHFGAGQTRVVRDQYVGEIGWSLFDRVFTYTLWTGSSWLGPIGDAELVVTLDDVDLRSTYVSAYPAVAAHEGRRWRWHLMHFDPMDFDLRQVDLTWGSEPRTTADSLAALPDSVLPH